MFEKVTSIFAKKPEKPEVPKEEQKVPVVVDGMVSMVPKSEVRAYTEEQREVA